MSGLKAEFHSLPLKFVTKVISSHMEWEKVHRIVLHLWFPVQLVVGMEMPTERIPMGKFLKPYSLGFFS